MYIFKCDPLLADFVRSLRFRAVHTPQPDIHTEGHPWASTDTHLQALTLPITSEILHCIYMSLSCWPWNRCHVSMATHRVPFLLMRAGEFRASLRAFTPRMLSLADLTIDSHQSPSIVSFHLHQSKTDPFRTGVTIHLGRMSMTICPVETLLD